MLNPGVEALGRRVLGEPKRVTAGDPGETASLASASVSSWKFRTTLYAKILRLLPRAVGAVVVGGDDIKRELALELREGLLLGTAATDDGEEGGQAEGHVRGHSVVFEVPVVGGER